MVIAASVSSDKVSAKPGASAASVMGPAADPGTLLEDKGNFTCVCVYTM